MGSSTTTDGDSSARRRAVHALGAHIIILQARLSRMRLERETLPRDAIADHIAQDLRIRAIESDLRLLRERLR
jgi:hypothetical protein